MSEAENNSTTENDSTNPIKKETNTDSQPEAKEESTTSSTQQQQNNVTATTETKPQNIEKKMLNLQLIKPRQKIHLLF